MASMISLTARRAIARPSGPAIALRASTTAPTSWGSCRSFHRSRSRQAIKPYLLADIGEGITEVQIIQWFVQPGARVEQFDKICEVQSDKATVEITSRFDGIIKKLYYEADDTARVGKPLVDIDIKSEIAPEDEALTRVPGEDTKLTPKEPPTAPSTEPRRAEPQSASELTSEEPRSASNGKHATLATPAVRHLIRELNVNIVDIQGTGKDGRVLKEDVQRHAEAQKAGPSATTTPAISRPTPEDKTISLTGVQAGMFRTMTNSLSIPHFLYTDSIDFSALNRIRKKLNSAPTASSTSPLPKLSSLPFIVKAVSLALQQHPLLNSHLDTTTNPSKPQILQKGNHNIGIAVDTPQGLVVPVIRAVQNHSILSLAAEIQRLSQLARTNKLCPSDFADATFTISNIGSIGGGVVAPIIVPPQVAILAVGQVKAVPAFNENGEVVRREECAMSWSADHRVVDGALAARCAEKVKSYLEDIERMLVNLR